MTAPAVRFPIRFDAWYRGLSTVLFLSPAQSYVEVSSDDVTVRMGWAFRATFSRSAVAATARRASVPLSRGVHGFAGRWLVNGSGEGILTLTLNPVQRAHVLGFPVTLRELMVSVDDPARLAEALRGTG